ncbi:MAG: pyridoxal phosphate-dependent aminotransferase [Gemmatimonadaceae bacterium]
MTSVERSQRTRPLESNYIEWSKAHGSVRYNLAISGVTPCDVSLLSPSLEDFTMVADNEYGWQPLLERIAERYGVVEESVVLAQGTSMANHLACAALLEPGDEVLLETPGYDPLRVVPEYLQCVVREFQRRADEGYCLDIAAIESALTPRVRLVIVSNLHNPSGALANGAELRRLAALADAHDFNVLVDEVYLEWLYGESRDPLSAIELSPRFITTRSLTKVYGLAALRAGWILAEPELAARMRRLNGLFTNSMSHPAERLAARALDKAAELLPVQRERVARNRKLVTEFVASSERLSWVPPQAGTVGFVRLEGGNVDQFVEKLLAKADTLVVPGRFFGAPDYFRIGFGMDRAILDEGLRRLGQALSG